MNNLDALLKIEKNVRGAIEVSNTLTPQMNKSQRRAWDRQILIMLETIAINIDDLKKRKNKSIRKPTDVPGLSKMLSF